MPNNAKVLSREERIALAAARAPKNDTESRECRVLGYTVEVNADMLALMQEDLAAYCDLAERAAASSDEFTGDANWWKDFFILSGQHMVLTEEGWQPGVEKQALIDDYGAEYIEDEVNAKAAVGKDGK